MPGIASSKNSSDVKIYPSKFCIPFIFASRNIARITEANIRP
jgi:hypothetical protein